MGSVYGECVFIVHIQRRSQYSHIECLSHATLRVALLRASKQHKNMQGVNVVGVQGSALVSTVHVHVCTACFQNIASGLYV